MPNSENVSGGRAVELLVRSVSGQLILLLTQMLIGMAVNLLGLPQESKGSLRIETSVALGAHVFVAIGLLVGAIMTVMHARRSAGGYVAMAVRASGAVVVAFAAGVLDLLVGSDWWSYLMAVAATLAIALYGALLLRVRRTTSPSAPPSRAPVHGRGGD